MIHIRDERHASERSPRAPRLGPGGPASDAHGRARRLLVPYDGSVSARAALERAAEIARRGDEVGVVNVMPEPGVSSRVAPFDDERARQEALLDEAARMLARRGVAARRIAAVGGEAAETLAVAESWHADLIVVGAERGRFSSGVHSAGGRIARRARCDVLVVHGATDGAHEGGDTVA